MIAKIISAILIAFCLPLTAHEADAVESSWPQFRGPGGQGDCGDVELPLHWNEAKGIAWKTALPGRGWSSPVILGNRAWLTTAVEASASESDRKSRTAGKNDASNLDVAKQITLFALEVDLESGKLLRQIKLFEIQDPDPIHSFNSFASPTPVLADGFCYCHFGTFGTASVDTASGKVVWRKTLPLEHNVGPGSSPVVVDDLLILTCDGVDQQYVAALRTADGELAWRTDRPPMDEPNGDLIKAFCTPLLIDVSGQQQLVIPAAHWFVSYEPETGEEIWRLPYGRGFSNVPRPVYDGKLVFMTTGFAVPQLWAVDPHGRGELSPTHVAWKEKKQMPTIPSPVLVEDRIVLVSDDGIASCFQAADGKRIWKKRLGGNYSASPILAGGRIYFLSRDGTATVIDSGPKYEVLAKNRLEGDYLASPVPYGESLLLRSDSQLVCIEGE